MAVIGTPVELRLMSKILGDSGLNICNNRLESHHVRQKQKEETQQTEDETKREERKTEQLKNDAKCEELLRSSKLKIENLKKKYGAYEVKSDASMETVDSTTTIIQSSPLSNQPATKKSTPKKKAVYNKNQHKGKKKKKSRKEF